MTFLINPNADVWLQRWSTASASFLLRLSEHFLGSAGWSPRCPLLPPLPPLLLSSYLTPVSETGGEGVHSPECLSARLKKRLDAAAPPSSSSSSSSESLSFLTAEEKQWLNGEPGNSSTAPLQIVISDDDEVVRSAQQEEDEAFARSLQAQFDREETHSRPHDHHHHHHPHHHLHHQRHHGYDPYMEPSWMPHLLAAVSPLVENDLIGQRNRRGRGGAEEER
ncbi:hypothetical protein F7725_023494 [Dissostichus mawsoni]|uniref:Uncharacterized protein n=1 Tax=Dissostichus mawsoni TaxID=36200 RepID=A0A7J5Z316_DISMA|nr:hypothetical protein F7725_023494 [Dissostichus mawsoni]